MVLKVPSSSAVNLSSTQSSPGILKKILLILRWRAGFLLLCSLLFFLGFMKLYASSILLANEVEASVITHTNSDTVTAISMAPSLAKRNGFSYDVMIDAGSTGSRIHVYKFSYSAGFPMLLNEIFEQVCHACLLLHTAL